MITLLSKIFIKKNTSETEKRTAYGMLCGLLGIALNIILFAGKLTVGLLSGSVSITADAFNNLSDAGSSIVTLCGFKLASAKPDPEHPYGHGRLEYVSGLVISAVIIVMAFELFKESVGKIRHPEATQFSFVVALVLIVSILIKCYMAFYNTSVAKKINSAALGATAKDSLSDCVATTVVLATGIFAHYTNLYLDGWCGVMVSLFIFYSGYSAARDSVSPLLGNPPDREFVDEIEQTAMHFDENIVGVHDLMVHDYGPGRKIISLHVEVPADGNILNLHDTIDNLEKKLAQDFGCTATIHMDPVDTKDPKVQHLKEEVAKLVREIHEEITIHDFRVVFGETHTNLIFDMAVPFSCPLDDNRVKTEVSKKIRDCLGEHYFAVTVVDRENYIHKG